MATAPYAARCAGASTKGDQARVREERDEFVAGGEPAASGEPSVDPVWTMMTSTGRPDQTDLRHRMEPRRR